VLGIGGRGVVAEGGDAVGDIGPEGTEGGEALVKNFLASAPDAQGVVGIERAEARGAGLEPVFPQGERDLVEILGAHLEDGAEFLVEEGGERVVAGGDFEVDAHMPGKGHLDHRGQQAAVGAVVVGEEFLFAAELLDDVPEILQVGGTIHIRRFLARLGNHLREDRASEPVFAPPKID
jgi:hypothetical protein